MMDWFSVGNGDWILARYTATQVTEGTVKYVLNPRSADMLVVLESGMVLFPNQHTLLEHKPGGQT